MTVVVGEIETIDLPFLERIEATLFIRLSFLNEIYEEYMSNSKIFIDSFLLQDFIALKNDTPIGF